MLDLLSVHLVRNINGSTIISFHPTLNIPATTAQFLHERIRFAGACKPTIILIYVSNLNFRPKCLLAKHVPKVARPHFGSPNIYMACHVCMGWGPRKLIWTYLFTSELCILCLIQYILTWKQESRVISTAEMPLTRELHVIRAHHLHYLSLLDHYTKHVTFIKSTPNPAMDGINEVDRLSSQKLLNRECDNLMNEIERLNAELNTQERRLKNVMDLVSYTIFVCQLSSQ